MTAGATLPIDTLLREQQRFRAFLQRRMVDGASADDVLQDAYVKAMQAGGTLREDEAVIPWFYRVLRNALIDHARRRDARQRAEGRAAAQAEVPQGADGLPDAVCACVTGLLPHLRPDQADILRRVELDGERVRDVAASLGVTPAAASVRLHRARRSLAGALGAVCGVCAHHGCRDCRCRGGPGGPAGSV